MRKLAFLLLEIFIGISLFGLLLFLGIDKFRANINMHPCYTVIFKDVDGLSVGSPVRLMGKQVGNIIKLELADSEIYVTFRIAQENTVIPDASIASIQFTGLAGSKSLEIMPPTKTSLKACESEMKNSQLCEKKLLSNKKTIYSQEPIRIDSILQVQTTIFENLLEFCRGLYTFFSKNSIDSTKKTMQTTSKYMQESNHSMGDTLRNIKQSDSEISKNTKEIKQFVNEQNKNINTAYESFNTLAKDKQLKNNMNNIQTTVEKLSTSIDTKQASKKVSELTSNLNNFNSNIKDFNKKISKVKNREVEYVSDINNSLQKTTSNLQGMIDAAKATFKKPAEKKSNESGT